MKKHRLIFFGTPEFATTSLHALQETGAYDIVAVVTQPDKAVGRKQIMTPPPVKVAAMALGIPVHQPTTLKSNKENGQKAIEMLAAYKPDVCVVVAYGKILPQEVLSMAPYGCVNVHGSLLPALRGPSPIQTAILSGLSETGVSIMLLEETMDTGPVLAMQSTPLTTDDTAATLHDRLKHIGAALLTESLPAYLDGTLTPIPQDDTQATYCSLIHKSDGEIDWNDPIEKIDQKIRAFTPWPQAFTYCGSMRVKILSAHIKNEGAAKQLVIDMVQPEGKKPMSYTDFLRGHPHCDFV